MFGKCTQCNKIFAMKKIEKKLVRQEDIKVLETLTQPHLKGEIQTMVERFVPGERKFYEITYTCRFCGAEQTKSVWEDMKQGYETR